MTSKRPRRNPPSMRPSFSPLRKTSAFQLMPSKLSQTCLPGARAGALNSRRYQKSVVEVRVGNHQLVVAEIGILDRASVDVAGEHGARHGGGQPLAIGEQRLRNRLASGLHLRSTLDAPATTGEVQAPVGPRVVSGPRISLSDRRGRTLRTHSACSLRGDAARFSSRRT